MGLSRADPTALMDAFEEFGWGELILSVNGTRVELTRDGKPPASGGAAVAAPARQDAPAQPAPEAPAPREAPAVGSHEVLAPSVGIFYVAPEPGAPAFAEVGAHVAADDIVCIVAVMKLMNHVKAGVDGVVRAVHAENGAMIEYGQPLFSIEPGA